MGALIRERIWLSFAIFLARQKKQEEEGLGVKAFM